MTDKTPDPMAQIEASLDRYCEARVRGGTIRSLKQRESLLALIRSALAAQPGQGEPKGWLCTNRGYPDVIVRSEKRAKAWAVEGFTVEPLYAYATPPTPATDDFMQGAQRDSMTRRRQSDEIAQQLRAIHRKHLPVTSCDGQGNERPDGAYWKTTAPDEAGVRAKFERQWPVTDDTDHDDRKLAMRWWLNGYRAALLGERT